MPVKIRSAADMVTAVPYLIGFHPGDGSIVVIVCDGRRVTFAARTDVPDPDAPARHMQQLADWLVPVVRQQQPITFIVVIGYGAAAHVDPALRMVEETLTANGLPVRELLRVTAGRYFSLTCDNPECCPPQGTPFDQDASLVAVQATAAGQVALPDREAVAARFAPVEEAARDRMRHATTAAAARMQTLTVAGSDAVQEAGATAFRDSLMKHDGGGCLSDDEMAWLILLITHPVVRDLAAELTQPHDGHVTFWAELTRHADESLVPAPASLLALTAWRCGDGALAVLAAEYALQVDPEFELAGLLLYGLQAGIAPSVIEEAFGGD